MKPKKGQTPFGYEPSLENAKELIEIPQEIEALEKIKDLVKEGSIRDGAAWIAHKTGRNISHQGLKNVIRERY